MTVGLFVGVVVGCTLSIGCVVMLLNSYGGPNTEDNHTDNTLDFNGDVGFGKGR